MTDWIDLLLQELIKRFREAGFEFPDKLETETHDEIAGVLLDTLIYAEIRPCDSKLAAYACPSCGRDMTLSATDTYICPTGHLRILNELRGKAPWKDTEGIWHDLNLGPHPA